METLNWSGERSTGDEGMDDGTQTSSRMPRVKIPSNRTYVNDTVPYLTDCRGGAVYCLTHKKQWNIGANANPLVRGVDMTARTEMERRETRMLRQMAALRTGQRSRGRSTAYRENVTVLGAPPEGCVPRGRSAGQQHPHTSAP